MRFLISISLSNKSTATHSRRLYAYSNYDSILRPRRFAHYDFILIHTTAYITATHTIITTREEYRGQVAYVIYQS
jgi:hypothetical protein